LLLVDSLTGAERFADAGRILEQAIAEPPRRRSPELAELQLRMARLAEIAGDRQLQLQWLAAALESDKNNGVVASELARLAMALGDHDTALNALRVVTLAKTEGSMSRAEAFLAQAQIAQERGEVRRALLWARKARSEDPELVAAEVFLQELGES
jgi:tetratricopeptide (TPR) repeat protein